MNLLKPATRWRAAAWLGLFVFVTAPIVGADTSDTVKLGNLGIILFSWALADILDAIGGVA